MKMTWKKVRRLAAVLLILACVFSQTLAAFATDGSEGLLPESTEETQTEPDMSSEAEEAVTKEPETEESETQTETVESVETTEEAETETESASETLPVYGAEETIETTETAKAAGEGTEPETTAPESVPDVEYRTHVQTFNWQPFVKNGEKSGTEGKSKRLEAIEIKVSNTDLKGDIEYQTHVQSYGWQGYVKNGSKSGTEGESKRLEGIRIRLTGELAEKYDVYYCVHAQTFGWLDWAKNGEMAGTSGLAKRLEAIRIKLVKKGEAAPESLGKDYAWASIPGVTYQTHQQTYGTMNWVSNGETAGVTGQSKRMESLAVKVTGETNLSGNIEYRTHVQTYGWRDWSKNGLLNGTVGEAKRLEALQVRLTGDLDRVCDVYYRLHVQGYGWLGWAKNGEMAGTSGLALRVEAIEIKIGPKSGIAPVILGGTTYHQFTKPGFYRIGGRDIYYSANGVQGGTTGWTRKDGNRYYLLNGAPVTGWRYIGGLKYYFNSDGSLRQNVDSIIGVQSSYQIKVNKQANCVTIYAADGANGYIIPVKAMLCSTGDDTPLGTRPTLSKHRWQKMYNGTVAQFATRLTPAPGVLFHSITYRETNNRTMDAFGYNGLGTVRSAGCIRLVCGDAYWLYQRCKVGTSVTVYNDENPGPFDRPVVAPIPADQTWDPTDPTL
jgi:uncharacterized protein YjdB